MGVYDQIKTAFEDIIAPEIRAIHGEIGTLRVEIHRLDEKVDSLRNELNAKIDALRTESTTKIDALEGKLIAEIRRLDGRIESLERELKTAIDIRERLVALEAKVRP
jgi:hypothetical protein